MIMKTIETTQHGDQQEEPDHDDRQQPADDVGDQHGQLEVQRLRGVPPDERAAVAQHQVADQGAEERQPDDAGDQRREVDEGRPQLLVLRVHRLLRCGVRIGGRRCGGHAPH